MTTDIKKDKKEDKPLLDRTRIGRYMQDSSNVFAENRFMRFIMVAMIIWSAFNTILLKNALDNQTTIIMPPDESYKYEITSENAGDKYLYRMARNIAFLAGNLNAASTRDQLNELLMLIHPDNYGFYQEHFNKLSKEAERYPNISYVIEINGKNAIEVLGDKMFVDLTKKRLVGDTVTRKDRMKFEIGYVIEEGRFYTTGVNELAQNGGQINESQ